MASIYVSIPSMQDSEYFNTIKTCYESQSGENDIYIGTAYNVLFNNKKIIQDVESKLPNIPNFQIKFINTRRNRGVGFGRLESMSFYNNQDFFLQCDSHTLFLKNWDKILIDAFKEAKEYFNLDKIIITGYAASYELIAEDIRVPLENNTTPMYPYYISNDEKVNIIDTWQGQGEHFYKTYNRIPKWLTPTDREEYDFVKNKFELATRVNANLFFCDRGLASRYSEMFPWEFGFFEEEFIMTIESMRMGYVPIFPNFPVNICHHYVDEFNEFYPGRESLFLDEKDLKLIKKKLYVYLDENKDIIEKYFNYAKIDQETSMCKIEKYIPSERDIFNGN